MKNKYSIYTIFAAVIVTTLSSCEKNLEVYHYPDNGLNFYYESAGDTVKNFSFVYGPMTRTIDTVWVKVETVGFITDKDRDFTFEQVQTAGTNAVVGKHYVAFDDASVKSYYNIPAGKSQARVPIIVKRDASLKTSSVNLLIKVKNNENFKIANPSRCATKIIVTDQLAKPTCWAYYAEGYFGTYGPVKHQFLIEQTGKKWDDEYLSNVLGFTSSSSWENGTNSNYDGGYCDYLAKALYKKLEAYNAARTAQGLEVLKEADGTVVAIPAY